MKRELQELLGVELKDKDLIDILIDSYERHRHLSFAELLKETTQKLYEVIELNEDYQRLREEVERLRRENELLKKEIEIARENAVEGLTSRQLFWKFIERVRKELKSNPHEEQVIDRLLDIGIQLFKDDRILPGAILRLDFSTV